MRSTFIAIIAAGVLLAILPSMAWSQDDPVSKRGPAIERIRAQAQKMRAEGKSDTEILEAMRAMIDRALAQRESGEKVRKEKGPAGAPARKPEKIQAAPITEKPCACPICPHNRAKPDRSLEIQQRIQAAARKMRAEGKSPEEIQDAVQKMKERARQALNEKATKSVPPPVRKKVESIEKKPGQPARLEKAPPGTPKLPQKAPIKPRDTGEL